MPLVAFSVSVEAKLFVPSPFKALYVVGDSKFLGAWNHERSFRLSVVNEYSENGIQFWSGFIDLPVSVVRYRYFIGEELLVEDTITPSLVVSQWESTRWSRSVSIEDIGSNAVSDVFGTVEGIPDCMDDGWLTVQHAVFIRANSSSLQMLKNNCLPSKMLIRASNLNDSHDEELPAFNSSTTVADLESLEGCSFLEQEKCGVSLGSELVFKTYTTDLKNLVFSIEFFDKLQHSVGTCHFVDLGKTTQEKKTLVLLSNNAAVGKFTIGLFVVKPMSPSMCDMSLSYSRYWKKRQTLDVGHRGMGCSYTKWAVAKENTIGSLQQAAIHGADFVEFDVQVTKDGVIVIFHDFHVVVEIKHKPGSVSSIPSLLVEELAEPFSLAVKDLKLSQLHLLKLKHETSLYAAPTDTKSHYLRPDINCEDDLCSELDQPFPTLDKLFRYIDEHVGFNIEIKHPMTLKDGSEECDKFPEQNRYIDSILDVVFRCAGRRRVLFSSFDPSICAMVKLKQNKYPVLLLSQGPSEKYPPYLDEIVNDHMLAVNYAFCGKLLGVNFNSEGLLKNPEPYHMAKKKGLISFVWGDDLASTETIAHFKKMGLDGVIYDRISEKEQKESVFLVEKRAKDTLLQPASTPSSPTKE